ncbi:MAG: hypothetical protein AAF447_04790 [Myxococcota bacterium]
MHALRPSFLSSSPRPLLAVLALSALIAPQAWAQPGLAGSWTYAGDAAEQRARERALDQAVAGFPGMFQGQARRRMEQQFAPASSLNITLRGDRLELRGGQGTLALTVGGPAVPVSGPNGSGQARATRSGGHLVVTLEGERGSRTTTYRLGAGGQTLVLATEVRGPRLEQPLRFESTYRRR